MIAAVRGPVLHIGLDHAVVEAGGVGYKVHATPGTLAGLHRGTEALLLTTMVVREDSMTLYGFSEDDSRELFAILQTVTGVGPRLAMAVLAVLEPSALRLALANGDAKALMRVPGVGKRVADRLIVDLRDKVGVVEGMPGDAGGGLNGSAPATTIADTVVEALTGLGFTAGQAEQATAVALEAEPAATSSVLLRSALASLGGPR
ncbi:Holliday junction branch migration protein RuvA [Hoyosella sp. G463]|uniref:Holliday junction branch migration complex subunit RuvA n=1 Tax=Lolliginicoccus lacisalsi TaxID=2742202 RepID=A0A927PKZ6_9ACTN|nr:Holliday junction branch migration protein RuvA [Lolliginicoccus lacisalsi]MBD8505324.1 Holliday junction branch migration protein RuvA [Lolliginicoccus lacisalsi]